MNLVRFVEGGEQNPIYQELANSSLQRHYHFLQSVVKIVVDAKRPFLSTSIIKALNFHAIVHLHDTAGVYRPCNVTVPNANGQRVQIGPPHYEVQSTMDDYVNRINWVWERTDYIELAAHVLWNINRIHPFVNGNGRTARAACYFVLCVKMGGLLPGQTIVPELLLQNKPVYLDGLRAADQGNHEPLRNLLRRLLHEQVGPSLTS